MSTILDYHIETAIRERYPTYLNNADAFNQLFPGVAPATLTEWRTALAQRPPAVVPAFARGTDKLPLIWVHLETENVQHRPLGEQVYYDEAGRRVDQGIWSQRVMVSIFAQTPTAMRCWHMIVIAIMQLSMPNLLKAGYLDVRWEDADDFSTDEQQIAEQYGLAGVTVRHLRFAAMSQVDFTHWDSAQAAKPWYVLASDQKTVDGKPGGVVPSP